MTYTQEEVDRIVAEVLRRIRSLRDAKSESFSIRERVVSLAVIDKLSEQVQSITVPHNAVITPSVQDELRYRKIRIFPAQRHHLP